MSGSGSACEVRLVDATVVDALMLECGPELFPALVESLAEEGAERLADLELAVAGGDAAGARAAAHALRGLALDFGLEVLAQEAWKIEAGARGGGAPGPEAAERARDLLTRSVASLRALKR